MHRDHLAQSGFAVAVTGVLLIAAGNPVFAATTKKLMELGYDIQGVRM